jgi:hypothetical protein
MKRLLVIAALMIGGCGGPAPAGSTSVGSPPPSPSLAPISSPQASAVPTAASGATAVPVTPTPSTGASQEHIAHVVAALDELSGMINTYSGDDLVTKTSAWLLAESNWLTENLEEIGAGGGPFSEYTDEMLLGLQALGDGSDYQPSLLALLALREDIAALSESPIATPAPTELNTYKPGDAIDVTTNGEPWATITVSKVSTKKKYDGPYNFDDTPARGNVYIQVFVTYVAKADGVDYNPYDWQIFADGTAVDGSAFVSNGPTPDLRSGSLPKGRKAAGWLVFEVPARGRVLMSYGNTFGDEPPVFEIVLRAK